MKLRGMAVLALWGFLALIWAPLPALAAAVGGWSNLGLPFRLVGTGSPLEAASPPRVPPSLLGTSGGLAPDQEGGTTVRLPYNLELSISFLYRGEPSSLDARGGPDSSLLYNYSLNYRLLPNLQVGLNGYLYRPSTDEVFSFQRPLGERVMGLGPGVRYNLGRWNFVFRSQLETGNPRGGDLQNWFRVWYAF